MKKPLKSNQVIKIGFYGGLAIKGVNALLEFIGGFLMLILSHEWLNRLILRITLHELREDPEDFVMNHFITLGQNFSISSLHSIAIYMLLHGISKLAMIWLLWKKKIWAYPLAVITFGLFITYEIYSYMRTQSVLMLLIIILDIAIIVMIILEYMHLKTK